MIEENRAQAMGASQPLVSVVVPVYRTDPSLLDECFASLSRQSLAPDVLQICVVFDGPQDESLANVVRKWGAQLTIFFDEIAKAGVSAARNKGIESARGTWIYFVDADDMVPDGALASIVHYAEAHPCQMLLAGYEKRMERASEFCWYQADSVEPSEDFTRKVQAEALAPDKNLGTVCAKLYRRSFIGNNALSFDESLDVAEDADFVFRAVHTATSIGFVHETAYIYRRNARSAVRSFRGDYADRIAYSMKSFKRLVNKADDEEARLHYPAFVQFHLMLIMVHYLFNPDAPWSESERKCEYERVLSEPVFAEALSAGIYEGFPKTRKISLFSLKHGMYSMSKTIAKVRQHQLG